MKKLYLISQDTNSGYDTYSDAVVCAESEDEAKKIHPSGLEDPEWWKESYNYSYSWCAPQLVKCEEIGIAHENIDTGIVVCSSFHAG